MKKIPIIFILITLIAGLFIGYGIGRGQQKSVLEIKKDKTITSLIPIRIGWQISWTPQGQLAQILKHTNILEQNGLKGEFKGFSYGGPASEAALAGELDVLWVADFPAINLLSKTEKWSLVGRLVDFRDAIIVPKNSSYQTLADLKGRVVSMPFGSGSHVYALKVLRENGFNPEQDFQVKNLDIIEQSNIIQKGTAESWSEIAAFVSWDPTIALFEEQGKARVLELIKPVGVIAMSNNFITQYPAAAQNFLKAFIQAYLYYAKNQSQANQWFAEEAKFSHPLSILDKTTLFENNLKAKKIIDIDVRFYDDHLQQMQSIADEGEKNGLLTKAPRISQRINQDILEAALKEIRTSVFDPKSIEVK